MNAAFGQEECSSLPASLDPASEHENAWEPRHPQRRVSQALRRVSQTGIAAHVAPLLALQPSYSLRPCGYDVTAGPFQGNRSLSPVGVRIGVKGLVPVPSQATRRARSPGGDARDPRQSPRSEKRRGGHLQGSRYRPVERQETGGVQGPTGWLTTAPPRAVRGEVLGGLGQPRRERDRGDRLKRGACRSSRRRRPRVPRAALGGTSLPRRRKGGPARRDDGRT